MQWHMPIGYKVVDGKITICEEQRKIVEQIFTDYDSGVAAGRIAQFPSTPAGVAATSVQS